MVDTELFDWKRLRTVVVYGEINQTTCQPLIEQLLTLGSENKPFQLLFHAYGEDLQAGLMLYDVIRGLGTQVKTIAIGEVYNAALLPFLAPPREHRSVLSHASLVRENKNEGHLTIVFDQILARQTGQPLERIEQHRTFKLPAQQAQVQGHVGVVIDLIFK